MKFNYLIKNMLLEFLGLALIVAILNSPFVLALSRHSFVVWLFLFLIFMTLFTLIRKRIGKFLSGYIGERDIDDELKTLGETYICISDFDTGRGNIDKIVIGPTGVWTIEVKSHKVIPVPLDPFLKQAYAEAKTLEDVILSKLNLTTKVQPVLVFSDKFAKVTFGLNPQNGVYVIQKDWLNKLLTETHNQSLDNTIVQKISSIISLNGD